jgi:hypothetical protein
MYYEINVSYNGQHVFATDERSITTSTKAKELYWLFLKKFPVSEGYKIDIYYWEKTGHAVDVTKL